MQDTNTGPVAASAQPTIQDDEISLLDLLVTVSANLKLLILGPLLVGLLALGGAYLWPATYESTAVLQAEKTVPSSNGDPLVLHSPAAVASLIESASVVDPVTQSMGLLQNQTAEQARNALRSQIKTSLGRQDKLLTLTVQAPTANAAQSLAQALLDQTFLQTRPRGDELARLQARLKEEQTSHQVGLALAANLLKSLSQPAGSAVNVDQLARAYADLLSANSQRLERIQALQAQMAGLTAADLVQGPIMPELPVAPKKALVAVLAALASGIALLLFVFVRQAWRNAAQDADSAAKLGQIRRHMGLRV